MLLHGCNWSIFACSVLFITLCVTCPTNEPPQYRSAEYLAIRKYEAQLNNVLNALDDYLGNPTEQRATSFTLAVEACSAAREEFNRVTDNVSN